MQLEEMRSTYEERLKALKQDLERRAKLVGRGASSMTHHACMHVSVRPS